MNRREHLAVLVKAHSRQAVSCLTVTAPVTGNDMPEELWEEWEVFSYDWHCLWDTTFRMNSSLVEGYHAVI